MKTLRNITFIVIAIALAMLAVDWARTEENRAIVQRVCSDSRSELNGATEERCGYLQDRYNIEFSCSSYAPNAYCWAEAN